MKLVIIRHADPDYERDSLTAQGWKEAELLAPRIAPMEVRDYYVSPLGRARDTASLTLKAADREAKVCNWLREFDATIHRPDVDHPIITWDWLPQDWTKEEAYFDRNAWNTTPIMKEGQVQEKYNWVISQLDSLLEGYGYQREGAYYRTDLGNNDTIVFFCHFGLECVLLSHLLNISPMVLWHGFCAAPSSVTTLVSEERRKGIAYWRMGSFGDCSHLYVVGEKPTFAARFRECYENEEERRD